MSFNWKPIKNIDYIVDYYKILEVDYDSSIDDIKKQYKKLAQEYHPDKFQKAGTEIKSLSAHKMNLILEAYTILGNHDKKKLFDLALKKFQETKPKCISDDGTAILDLSSETYSLDFLLSGHLKFDFQDNQENKASLLIGYNKTVFDMMEKAYLANPSDENIKKAYLEQLTKKKLELDWKEKFAWQELGVMNASEVKVQGALDYLDAVKDKLEKVTNTYSSKIEMRLLSCETEPLLLTDNRKIDSPSNIESSLSTVKAEIEQVIKDRQDKLLALAQEKQDFLAKMVKIRTTQKLFSGTDKNISIILYHEEKVMTTFELKFNGEEPEPLEISKENDNKLLSEITSFSNTTYSLLYNHELDLVFQVVEYINDLVNED